MLIVMIINFKNFNKKIFIYFFFTKKYLYDNIKERE